MAFWTSVSRLTFAVPGGLCSFLACSTQSLAVPARSSCHRPRRCLLLHPQSCACQKEFLEPAPTLQLLHHVVNFDSPLSRCLRPCPVVLHLHLRSLVCCLRQPFDCCGLLMAFSFSAASLFSRCDVVVLLCRSLRSLASRRPCPAICLARTRLSRSAVSLA